MTDITADDEREAREWLADFIANSSFHVEGTIAERDHYRARTILALLDRPRLPKPEDVPASVMVPITDQFGVPCAVFRALYRALYDHYTAPPKRERWLVVMADGTENGAWRTRERAQDMANDHRGSRIVRLVEADSHD